MALCTWHNSDKCCELSRLFIVLSDGERTFLESLLSIWQLGERYFVVATNMLKAFFDRNSTDAHWITICLLYNYADFSDDTGIDFNMFVINALDQWRKSKKCTVPENVKINSLKLSLLQTSYDFTRSLVKAYEIDVPWSLPICFMMLKCLLSMHKYKQVAILSTILHMESCFDFKDFLLPLFLQKKRACIHKYLQDNINHRKQFLTYLDNLLSTDAINKTLTDFVEENNLPRTEIKNITSKYIKTCMKLWVRAFTVPSTIVPNYAFKGEAGLIDSICKSRYIDRNLDGASWRHMVQQIATNEHRLQIHLLETVWLYGDLSEALWLTTYYNISKENHWPKSLLCPTSALQEAKTRKNDYHYHQLRLTEKAIIVIDTRKAFSNMIDTAFTDIDMVAMDCEWLPFFSRKRSLALMQLATRQNVYLLDALMLRYNCFDLWKKLDDVLFKNSKILKLGFDFRNDFITLKYSLPYLNIFSESSRFVDLAILWRILDRVSLNRFPYKVPDQNGGQSLSKLVNICLGLPLNKSDRIELWERRPLTRNQLVYAALDAYCVVEVFNVMKWCYTNVNFDIGCSSAMFNSRNLVLPKISPYCDIQLRTLEPVLRVWRGTVNVAKLTLACDIALSSLVEMLDYCGADCFCISRNHDPLVYAHCIENGDFSGILVLDDLFEKCSRYLTGKQLLRIVSEDVYLQLAEVLLYYNVFIPIEVVERLTYRRAQGWLM